MFLSCLFFTMGNISGTGAGMNLIFGIDWKIGSVIMIAVVVYMYFGVGGPDPHYSTEFIWGYHTRELPKIPSFFLHCLCGFPFRSAQAAKTPAVPAAMTGPTGVFAYHITSGSP